MSSANSHGEPRITRRHVDPSFEAALILDPQSRVWELYVTGPAHGMITFLMDNSETSIIDKLWHEAQFDKMQKFEIQDLDEEAERLDGT